MILYATGTGDTIKRAVAFAARNWQGAIALGVAVLMPFVVAKLIAATRLAIPGFEEGSNPATKVDR